MADNSIRMPSGTAGITRYYDEYKSKLIIRPEHVVALCIVAAILLLVLHGVGA